MFIYFCLLNFIGTEVFESKRIAINLIFFDDDNDD